MNIWSMALETEKTKNATQERYATAEQASEAYKNYYGYVFYGSQVEIGSEDWQPLTFDYDDSEESGWAYWDAVAFDGELFWERLMTEYQGYAY